MKEFNTNAILFIMKTLQEMDIQFVLKLNKEQQILVQDKILEYMNDGNQVVGLISTQRDESIQFFDRIHIKDRCAIFDKEWKIIVPSGQYIYIDKKPDIKNSHIVHNIDTDEIVIVVQNNIEYYTHINNLER